MVESPSSQHRRRTLALASVVAAYVLSFFQRFAPAGIASDLAAAFNTSASSLGALAATYFYVYTLMQVPTGILVDTLGARRILLMGGLVGGAGSLMFGLAPGLELALLGRTLIGLGVSVTFIAMLKIIAISFEERRFATLVGWVMDRRWQGGLTPSGARLFTPEYFHAGLLLLVAVAAFGAIASWWICETGCRNIWQPSV